MSTQWFVKMAPLAKPAVEAVKRGDTRFVPERFEKIYDNWMNVIGVVRGGDLDHAGAKVLLHIGVGHHRNFTAHQRQNHRFSHEVPIALIVGYRGERIINWCPHCRTSISDAEVEFVEKDAFFYHLRYPLADGSAATILASVAMAAWSVPGTHRVS